MATEEVAQYNSVGAKRSMIRGEIRVPRLHQLRTAALS